MTEQEAAVQQFRETLIKSGIEHAKRLRELRGLGQNYSIAVSTSGCLAIILDDKDQYRFGPVYSSRVQAASESLVARWNRQAPAHCVELMPIQQALSAECSRIFLLLHELQNSVERAS